MKMRKSYRLTDSFTFKPVEESGEIRDRESGLSQAASYTNQASSYATMYTVPRQAFVNDDMGAVVELRRYPGMPHTVNQEELEVTRALLEHVINEAQG